MVLFQMSELSFLLELLLNHKVPQTTKKLIQERIREVESHIQAPALQRQPSVRPSPTAQEPQPVIANTAAAAEALAAREALIQQATSGRAEPGRTSPRKF
jgi:hypothetical protein